VTQRRHGKGCSKSGILLDRLFGVPIAMTDDSRKEREILRVMRKVLAQIIKDTTPPSRAMKHPLSDQTVQDVRHCLGLISLRERELADGAGAAQERPYYSDESVPAEVIPVGRIGRAPKDTED
jgi:hypothetical protein